uniref:Nucleotide-diphospho-sugar transferase domain-containing protein n=1 Tax=Chromera velia CCMP2878 TaxID=1169474 RepID=A0A0G4GP55_9ALVE|eukprot:Cvel_22764.t1-p1 / transcript=Cvel_22764.t1 / gene=Cvel_22764 / organism=Chromera_velia_CCMP2878 / gene_product=Galactomannan galactosyltransferase 1, putative / transcript_product=Galactomannan galactosyltransferase 1, putative / location=Cvel_scaffold2274:18062-21069(-) / protein_length=453 / sequence_SO=supercontig / SO=protein_coding / is_pseudo=false
MTLLCVALLIVNVLFVFDFYGRSQSLDTVREGAPSYEDLVDILQSLEKNQKNLTMQIEEELKSFKEDTKESFAASAEGAKTLERSAEMLLQKLDRHRLQNSGDQIPSGCAISPPHQQRKTEKAAGCPSESEWSLGSGAAADLEKLAELADITYNDTEAAKILIVRSDDREALPKWAETINKEVSLYAAKHKFEIYVERGMRHIDPYWRKPFLVRDLLDSRPDVDYIWFLDTDAFPFFPERSLRPLLKRYPNKSFFTSLDFHWWKKDPVPQINAGVFVVRNDFLGKAVMDAWIQGRDHSAWLPEGACGKRNKAKNKKECKWAGVMYEQGSFNKYMLGCATSCDEKGNSASLSCSMCRRVISKRVQVLPEFVFAAPGCGEYYDPTRGNEGDDAGINKATLTIHFAAGEKRHILPCIKKRDGPNWGLESNFDLFFGDIPFPMDGREMTRPNREYIY